MVRNRTGCFLISRPRTGLTATPLAPLAVALVLLAGCQQPAPPVPAVAPATEPAAEPAPGSGQAADDGSASVAPSDEGSSEIEAAQQTGPVTSFAPATEQQQQLLELGYESLRRGQDDRGVTALLALTQTPESSEVRAQGAIILADHYLRTEQTDRARAMLDELRRTTPPLAQLEYLAGLVAAEPTDAEAAFRQAMRIDSTYLPSYIALIAWYEENQRPDEAAEVRLRLEREIYRIGERLDSAAAPEERVALIQRLASTPPSLAATQSLIRALDDDDLEVVAHAVAALGESGTAEAIEPLRRVSENASIEEMRALVGDAILLVERRSNQPATP